jgi:hypothetical protein
MTLGKGALFFPFPNFNRPFINLNSTETGYSLVSPTKGKPE